MGTPRPLSVAVIQTSYGLDMEANIRKTADLVRAAADKGGQVILPSELFQGPYFCVTQEERWFSTAYPWAEHPCVVAMAAHCCGTPWRRPGPPALLQRC